MVYSQGGNMPTFRSIVTLISPPKNSMTTSTDISFRSQRFSEQKDLSLSQILHNEHAGELASKEEEEDKDYLDIKAHIEKKFKVSDIPGNGS